MVTNTNAKDSVASSLISSIYHVGTKSPHKVLLSCLGSLTYDGLTSQQRRFVMLRNLQYLLDRIYTSEYFF